MAQLRRMRFNRVLAYDIGGTGLKAAIVDARGKFLTEKVRIETPHPCPPKLMVTLLCELAAPLGRYDAITIGFPGYVKHGVVHTAPNLGTEDWAGFALEKAMSKALGKPTGLVNDADVQGLGAIKGRGLELVVTLGTGFGTAWFEDGRLLPHLEMAHVPIHHKHDFDAYVGEAQRKKISAAKWNRRVQRALEILKVVFNYEHIYIGGGNARRIKFKLPSNASLIPNEDGMVGAAFVWNVRPSGKRKAPGKSSPPGKARRRQA
jgi:polyphosphate glucokinase